MHRVQIDDVFVHLVPVSNHYVLTSILVRSDEFTVQEFLVWLDHYAIAIFIQTSSEITIKGAHEVIEAVTFARQPLVKYRKRRCELLFDEDGLDEVLEIFEYRPPKTFDFDSADL